MRLEQSIWARQEISDEPDFEIKTKIIRRFLAKKEKINLQQVVHFLFTFQRLTADGLW
jgi:translation initiation factor IF-3